MKPPTVFDVISILRIVAWEHPDDPGLRRQMEEAIAIMRVKLPTYRRIIKRYQEVMDILQSSASKLGFLVAGPGDGYRTAMVATQKNSPKTYELKNFHRFRRSKKND